MLVSSDQRILLYFTLESPTCLWVDSSPDLMSCLPHKTLTGEEPGQQLLYPSSNSFRVVIGVLVASLTSLLLALLLSLWRWSALGRFTVSYSFHFLMMDFTELQGMFSDLIFSFFLWCNQEYKLTIDWSFRHRCLNTTITWDTFTIHRWSPFH